MNKLVVIFCITFFIAGDLYPVVIDANTAMTQLSHILFPRSDTNNIINGFAAADSGFGLQDALTSCTYNAFFPVSGPIILNGGALALQQDLVLRNGGMLATTGVLYGNNRSVSITSLDDQAVTEMPLSGFIGLSQKTSYNAETQILSVDWSYNGSFLALGVPEGLFGLLGDTIGILQFVNEGLVTRASANLGTQVNAVRWHPSYFHVAVGGNVALLANELAIYEFVPATYSFSLRDSLNIGATVYALAWRPQGDYLATSRNNSSAELAVYPYNTTTKTLGTPITADITPNGTPATGGLDWSPSGSYLAVGLSSNSGTELQLYYFNSSTLTFTLGAELGHAVESVSWAPDGQHLAVGLSGSSSRLRIFKHNSAQGTLTQVCSLDESLSVLSTHWKPNEFRLAIARAAGSGAELCVYNFNPVTQQLHPDGLVEIGLDVAQARWSPTSNYLARCDTGTTITVYEFADGRSLANNVLTINNVKIILDTDLLVKVPIKFQGNCTLDGNGHHVTFYPEASFIVDAGASLLCQRLTITASGLTPLHMIDQKCSITLSDVTWELDHDLTITQGHFVIKNDVHLRGPHTVIFRSAQQGLVDAYSTLYTDNGLTFSYDPAVPSSTTFGLYNNTSVWHMCGTTLHVTTTGFNLSKGMLRVEGACYVHSEAATAAQGITFGDGVLASSDLTVDILPESGLYLTGGHLVYQNIQ